jgi:hypothetical protein
VTDKLSLN